MIIGISGKIGSGKDTVGKIILDLLDINYPAKSCITIGNWQIKKFADKLKDIVCILISCTKEQLEDETFKNTELGEEWNKWKLNFIDKYQSYTKMFLNKEKAEKYLMEQDNVYFYNFEEIKLTPRLLLQLLGTDCGRDIIHPNIWVNSLMNEYKDKFKGINILNTKTINIKRIYQQEESKWIITDVRFPNELKSIKDRNGISIRVNRPKPECTCSILTAEHCIKTCDKSARIKHTSETALDNAEFDYVIDNNSTIEKLIEKVKEILIKENIITE